VESSLAVPAGGERCGMVTLQQAAELVRQGDLARLERLPEGEVAQLASKVDEGELASATCMVWPASFASA
jgi:anaerobic glycerol-3-phosphate dehydrogenase